MPSALYPLFALLVALGACASAPAAIPGSSTIDTRGGAIFVQQWGTQSGPDILLIHGSTSHSTEFAVSLAPTLGADFHLTAFDRPGMGRSTNRPADAHELAVQATTAADVIRAQSLESPIVVGHSYGGAVALRLALDYPDLVSGLVLLAPASHPWDGDVPFFYDLQATPVFGHLMTWAVWPASEGAARASFSRRTFAPAEAPANYYEEAEVHLAMRPAAIRASSKDLSSLKEQVTQQAPRYDEITVPVALIVGADDLIAPIADNLDPANPAWSNTDTTILENVGHMPQHARPDLVKEKIEWVRASAAK